jgi:hypothetical protein
MFNMSFTDLQHIHSGQFCKIYQQAFHDASTQKRNQVTGKQTVIQQSSTLEAYMYNSECFLILPNETKCARLIKSV